MTQPPAATVNSLWVVRRQRVTHPRMLTVAAGPDALNDARLALIWSLFTYFPDPKLSHRLVTSPRQPVPFESNSILIPNLATRCLVMSSQITNPMCSWHNLQFSR